LPFDPVNDKQRDRQETRGFSLGFLLRIFLQTQYNRKNLCIQQIKVTILIDEDPNQESR
jgi:hypothetical protein